MRDPSVEEPCSLAHASPSSEANEAVAKSTEDEVMEYERGMIRHNVAVITKQKYDADQVTKYLKRVMFGKNGALSNGRDADESGALIELLTSAFAHEKVLQGQERDPNYLNKAALVEARSTIRSHIDQKLTQLVTLTRKSNPYYSRPRITKAVENERLSLSDLNQEQTKALNQLVSITKRSREGSVQLLAECQWNVEVAIAAIYDSGDPGFDAAATLGSNRKRKPAWYGDGAAGSSGTNKRRRLNEAEEQAALVTARKRLEKMCLQEFRKQGDKHTAFNSKDLEAEIIKLDERLAQIEETREDMLANGVGDNDPGMIDLLVNREELVNDIEQKEELQQEAFRKEALVKRTLPRGEQRVHFEPTKITVTEVSEGLSDDDIDDEEVAAELQALSGRLGELEKNTMRNLRKKPAKRGPEHTTAELLGSLPNDEEKTVRDSVEQIEKRMAPPKRHPSLKIALDAINKNPPKKQSEASRAAARNASENTNQVGYTRSGTPALERTQAPIIEGGITHPFQPRQQPTQLASTRGHQAETTSADDFSSKLDRLGDLGYTDTARNYRFLFENAGNIDQTIERLKAEADKDVQPPVPSTTTSEREYKAALALAVLRGLGYPDDKGNLELLRRFRGDVDQALDHLERHTGENSQPKQKVPDIKDCLATLPSLRSMGFADDELNMEALVRCGGNMEQATALLQSLAKGTSQSDTPSLKLTITHRELERKIKALQEIGSTDVAYNIGILKRYNGDVDLAANAFFSGEVVAYSNKDAEGDVDSQLDSPPPDLGDGKVHTACQMGSPLEPDKEEEFPTRDGKQPENIWDSPLEGEIQKSQWTTSKGKDRIQRPDEASSAKGTEASAARTEGTASNTAAPTNSQVKSPSIPSENEPASNDPQISPTVPLPVPNNHPQPTTQPEDLLTPYREEWMKDLDERRDSTQDSRKGSRHDISGMTEQEMLELALERSMKQESDVEGMSEAEMLDLALKRSLEEEDDGQEGDDGIFDMDL